MNDKPRLLYVEDDVSLAFVTRDNLQIQGFDVTHCEDGMSALNAFRKGNYDLCVLDVMLPEMDGFEFCKKIKTDGHSQPAPPTPKRSKKSI